MVGQDLVRPSRDGDQFHYHWAARHCLELLPGGSDLVVVTIEGPSVDEVNGDGIEAGEELIDVGLYYGSENLEDARLIRYIQLKHSTREANEPWTASGLKKTITGFAKRYGKIIERFPPGEVAQRFRFEFTTNRPICSKVTEALEDLASGSDDPRHPYQHQTLVRYAGLDGALATQFFKLFSAEGGEDDLWEQRNLLVQDISTYLPDADYDAPVQLKELVTRKATTEFEYNPSIRQHDVLRALKTSEDQLHPAECRVADISHTLAREQEQDILESILSAKSPVIIHADGGIGKSVIAARVAATMPAGSVAVLYDCFGNGLYRNSLHFRHRHRDALVQLANEIAAQGLCHPLIQTPHADAKQYMRAFLGRLTQAASLLRARNCEARLCLIIDAADNAEMAAEEQREPGSFVRDLIRTPLPEGVRLALTCRTHRRAMLGAPLEAQEIELRPFSEIESARHLRSIYPSATDGEVAEFAFLSSANPRVQALALSRKLPLQESLKQLGPEPTTVDCAIGELLKAAVEKLKDQAGNIEASQIEVICQGLAVLRPLVPIPVLAQLSGTSESAVRSFALDLGRPLLLKGNSLHFLDEPAETWFREHFQPDTAGLTRFIERLRPLASMNSYVAASIPQLLLHAGHLDELVELALSAEGLPTENPLERRDVELQRLTFALKACLLQQRYMAAAKLALLAGGECAGEKRQNTLIQGNTDLAAALMAPDRIEEIVSRRVFGSGWMGSHHAFNAGLLSGFEQLSAEASSHLRMAIDWLHTWARLSEEERRNEHLDDTDRVELAMALLRLRSPDAAAGFLRSWTWRRHAFEAGRRLGRRLIDHGRYDQVDALAEAAGNDVWLLLSLAVEAESVGHPLPAAPLKRLLRLLAYRRVQLQNATKWNAHTTMLDAVRAAVELALHVLPPEPDAWAAILRRYLPNTPPHDLTSRYGNNHVLLLRAYTLEAALRGGQLALLDIAPSDVRKQLEKGDRYGHSQETSAFLLNVGGLLPWFVLSTEISCGRIPPDLPKEIEAAFKATTSAENERYQRESDLWQTVAIEWFEILRDVRAAAGAEAEAFRSWVTSQTNLLWPSTLISLCHSSARTDGFESMALDFASAAYKALESSREDAEWRADSYARLARAILATSTAEAGVFFDRAVEIASRIGDENLSRWAAFLKLGVAAAENDNPRPRTAYRLSRIAELTYEYVARDKHFDWEGTVEALADLCPSSALAILSRWRDRRFGVAWRLLPLLLYRLEERGLLPVMAPIAFAGVDAEWDRIADLKRVVAEETDRAKQSLAANISYRYIRVQPWTDDRWSALREFGEAHALDFPDIDRIIVVTSEHHSIQEETPSPAPSIAERGRRSPDWDAIFHDVDLSNGEALRSAYAEVRTYDPPYEFKIFFQEALTRVKAGQASDLVRAIADWPDFGMFELQYLLDAIPKPVPRQVSFQRAVRNAVLVACRRQPTWVQRRGWGSMIPFEQFDKEGLIPDREVVRATLEGYTNQLDTLGANNLFELVDLLSACISPEEADEVLHFGLDLLEEMLRPEDGDGPWRSELQPPHSLDSALAGYVWAGLGSPVAAERWQYAHVVRSIVELGWLELLKELTAWAEAGTAGCFTDQGLDFYCWHARQWLLIGLARGGLENAGALHLCTPLFQKCLLEEHVVIRQLAAQALRTLVSADEITTDEVGDIDTVNMPQLPDEVYTGWMDLVADDKACSEGSVSDDEKYYFGIDIGPYWFSSLGRAFGLTHGAVERRARHVLRQRGLWNGECGRQEDARAKRKIFDGNETYHSHGSMPETDDLRAYHGYHAMMFVAADLLRERSRRRNSEEETDDFSQWLSDHLLTRSDERWLADRRDPRLAAPPPPPKGYGDKLWRWSATPTYIDQQLETDDSSIVFWGHWSGGERDYKETVSVRSALVSRATANSLVAALQTAQDLGYFALPSVEGMDDVEGAGSRLMGWVTSQSISARLDEGDPWAEGLHYPGPAPSEEIIAKLGLVESGDCRTWKRESESLLRSETWTHVQGYGRESETISGWRLSGDERFLKYLLDAYPEDCLILSVEVERRTPRSGSDTEDLGGYPRPYARYYLMEADGVAQAL